MNTISLDANGLGKDFNRRSIFRDISFSLKIGDSLAITGKNGAGKSTLIKILAGLLQPSKGSVQYYLNDIPIGIEKFKHNIGFVSPYLNLYEEFTAIENLYLLTRIRTASDTGQEKLKEVLSAVSLWHRRDDIVGTFSSGMKQRLKYAFALLHNPLVLILDEPTSNLDSEGFEFVQHLVQTNKETHIIIIATNDRSEVRWCGEVKNLGNENEHS